MNDSRLKASVAMQPLQIETPPEATTAASMGKPMEGKIFYIALSSLSVIALLDGLMTTALAPAIPVIIGSLHGSALEGFWAGTSFLLCACVFQPTFASLSQIFGRKPLLFLVLLLFTVGTIISAVAHGVAVLLLGRSIQGAGSGGILAMTLVIMTDIVTIRERGKWMGVILMQYAIGTIMGPIIGGAIVENISWRWIFWVVLPVCGFAFVMIFLFKEPHVRAGSMLEKLKMIDWFGQFLVIASPTAILIPISWGGLQYPWNSWRVLVPLILGIFGLIVFGFYEIYVAKEPVVVPRIMANRTAASIYFGSVITGILMFSELYYLPLYFEVAKGYSPLMAGVALIPQTFSICPASVITGILITRTGRYRWAIWSGWALTVLGTGLLYLLDVHTPTAVWVVIGVASVFGVGMNLSAMSIGVQATASDADLPTAAALYTFFRLFGQSAGVAIAGSIFQNQMERHLRRYADLAANASMLSKDAASLVLLLKTMPDSERKENIIQSYVDSLQIIWITMMGFSIAGFLTSFLVRGISLDRRGPTS
ncbi:MFS general substrate transporter [Glarea lozoyensis ATCC 20868]|uniref:MFS general substrate transporter n=1 Tax=Glarea lozoyensis (strain ATCC 20868 / MF5171) TaxID=1116229 RepID=S3DUN9_GLAL2|nr:MFS general substrate transporter [Glarea lozoyensis ATCC 20868]EPE30143.1 MFS general substrate transporter [Glarea lozoyensis ATCC 20868]